MEIGLCVRFLRRTQLSADMCLGGAMCNGRFAHGHKYATLATRSWTVHRTTPLGTTRPSSEAFGRRGGRPRRYAMRIWRHIERAALWIALVVGIVATGVIIGRPAEKSAPQATFAGAELQKKRLAVFLDGTWNSVDSNTNVWRMRDAPRRAPMANRSSSIILSASMAFWGGVFG